MEPIPSMKPTYVPPTQDTPSQAQQSPTTYTPPKLPSSTDVFTALAMEAPRPRKGGVPAHVYNTADHDTVRSLIFSGVEQSLKNLPPVEWRNYRVRIEGVHYPKDALRPRTKAEHKAALMAGGTMDVPIKGTVILEDKETGEELDRKNTTLLRVPYLSPHGTFIRKGSDYAIAYQKRLRPGAYIRRTNKGDYEAMVLGADKHGFNIGFIPDKGKFNFKIHKSNVPLYAVMRGLGVTDRELRNLWGDKLFDMNQTDDWQKPLAKLWRKLKRDPNAELPKDLPEALREEFGRIVLDPETTSRTLGKPFGKVTPTLIGTVSKNLLDTMRGKRGPDNRDSFSFQTIRGKEDLFVDKLMEDYPKLLRQQLYKAGSTGNLKGFPAQVLSPSMDYVFYKSKLGQSVEEINPIDAFDAGHKITGMGMGGFSSPDVIPDQSRKVQNSQIGIVDAIRTAESGNVGVDARIAYNTFKGADGQLYARFRNKSGKTVYLPGKDIEKHVIAFPLEFDRVKRGETKLVKAMKNGKLRYVRPDEVDYEIHSPQEMFSLNTNLIPLMSGVKGMRALMGSKYSLSSDSTIVMQRADGSVYCGTLGDYEWREGDTAPATDSLGAPTMLPVMGKSAHHSNVPMYRILLSTGDSIRGTECHSFMRYVPLKKGGYSLMEDTPSGMRQALSSGSDVFVPVLHGARIHGEGTTWDGEPLDSGALWWLGYIYANASSQAIGSDYIRMFCRESCRYPVDAPSGNWRNDVKKSFATSGMSQSDTKTRAAYIGKRACRIDIPVSGNDRLMSWLDPDVFERNFFSLSLERQTAVVEGIVSAARYRQPASMYTNIKKKISKFGIKSQRLRAPRMIIGDNRQLRGLVAPLRNAGIICSISKCTHPQSDKGGRYLLGDCILLVHAIPKAFAVAIGNYEKNNIHTHTDAFILGVGVENVSTTPLAGEVYDLHMQDGTFTANGFVVVHNSNQGISLTHNDADLSSKALVASERDEPLVQSMTPEGGSFHKYAGKIAGAVRTNLVGGTVVKVTPDTIVVKAPNGETETHDLYNYYPLNRKTFLHNIPTVKVGDTVKKGDLLAESNFTKNGALSLGRNLRLAYLPYLGKTYEDGVVVSESAARKLASWQMYSKTMDKLKTRRIDKSAYRGVFPAEYTGEQLKKIGDDGVAKVGTILNPDDPVILAVDRMKARGRGQLSGGKVSTKDGSITWDHSHPGLVTDVSHEGGRVKVNIQSIAPLEIGDKLALAYGNKGVVSAIIPDEAAPKNAAGEHTEILINPYGIISRHNPAQVAEALLGKIAAKRGKPYVIPGFMGEDITDFVDKELEKHGVSPEEALYDGTTGKKLGDDKVTGIGYVFKVHHMAESKESGGGDVSYTSSGTPAQTLEGDNPKRIGLLEVDALLAHGVPNVIKDVKLVRGQNDRDVWQAIMSGKEVPNPKIPLVYKKLIASLQSAGINVRRAPDAQGNLQLTAMTDEDINRMSAGEVKLPETVKWKASYERNLRNEEDLDPVPGGLFDRAVTGGMGGKRFSHIQLSDKFPQPVFEHAIRTLLGISEKKLLNVIAGRETLPGYGTGSKAIESALTRIDPKRELAAQKEIFRSERSVSAKNTAAKKIRVLNGLISQNKRPSDYMVSKVLVLPPVFRPISINEKFEIVADSNLLYKDLMDADKAYSRLRGIAGSDIYGDAAVNTYKALKAVVGMADPVKRERVQQNVKGILSAVFGPNGVKTGIVQRHLIGTPTSHSARGVIVPDPNLNMDEIGIPVKKLWELYEPFVIRRMIKASDGSATAKRQILLDVEKRSPNAFKALLAETKERPVLYSRAPVLHRLGILAGFPVPVPGHAIRTNTFVTPGLNADFDGDTYNAHAIASEKAKEEAIQRMLPSTILRGSGDFGLLYKPMQDFRMGLALASKADGRKGRLVTDRKYSDPKDIFEAYKRGKLGLADTIVVAK